jgi:hypothetical protein
MNSCLVALPSTWATPTSHLRLLTTNAAILLFAYSAVALTSARLRCSRFQGPLRRQGRARHPGRARSFNFRCRLSCEARLPLGTEALPRSSTSLTRRHRYRAERSSQRMRHPQSLEASRRSLQPRCYFGCFMVGLETWRRPCVHDCPRIVFVALDVSTRLQLFAAASRRRKSARGLARIKVGRLRSLGMMTAG